MDNKTIGAWIIHHSQKLRAVAGATEDYEQLDFSGKCGVILNSLAGSSDSVLDMNRVIALTKAAGYSSRTDLPAVLDELEKQRLIDRSDNEISVLGLTTGSTLEHTATIFQEIGPQNHELACIDIAEKSSFLPIIGKEAKEYISNTYKVASCDTDELLGQFHEIGFVDSESVGNESIYFNGNLFRKDEIRKINGILSSLTGDENQKAIELSTLLDQHGCVAKNMAQRLVGEQLYSKLIAIGFVDENGVGNESGIHYFVTKPSAFTKFTNAEIDDAFDLAKAFVTSLTYGMMSSPSGRGRITMIEALMQKLLQNAWVGPATAIGQDYKILEMKGVIATKPEGNGRYYMKLLKEDIGQLALKVIQEGNVSTETILQLPSVSANNFKRPELNRTIERKKQTEPLRRGVAGLLNDLRTGGIR
jgi:hypothetical protein